MKAINHSCTFLFFLCISVALFVPPSSSLTCSHSPRVYQQGTTESKNHSRGQSAFTRSACVLILPFIPASKWLHSKKTPESALPVGFRKSKHMGFIVQNIFFFNYRACGGGGHPCLQVSESHLVQTGLLLSLCHLLVLLPQLGAVQLKGFWLTQ